MVVVLLLQYLTRWFLHIGIFFLIPIISFLPCLYLVFFLDSDDRIGSDRIRLYSLSPVGSTTFDVCWNSSLLYFVAVLPYLFSLISEYSADDRIHRLWLQPVLGFSFWRFGFVSDELTSATATTTTYCYTKCDLVLIKLLTDWYLLCMPWLLD